MVKSPEMVAQLDRVANETFGRTRTEAHEQRICVMCGNDAVKFDDLLSAKEYRISAMCQACQNQFFGTD